MFVLFVPWGIDFLFMFSSSRNSHGWNLQLPGSDIAFWKWETIFNLWPCAQNDLVLYEYFMFVLHCAIIILLMLFLSVYYRMVNLENLFICICIFVFFSHGRPLFPIWITTDHLSTPWPCRVLRRHFGLKSPLHFMSERTRTASEWEDISGRSAIFEHLFRWVMLWIWADIFWYLLINSFSFWKMTHSHLFIDVLHIRQGDFSLLSWTTKGYLNCYKIWRKLAGWLVGWMQRLWLGESILWIS